MLDFLKIHQRKILIASLILLVISATGSFFYFRQRRARADHAQAPEQPDEITELAQREIDQGELTTLNVLLLGYGGAGHQGGFLTDVIQLLHLDFETQQVAVISIPRDLWVKLPNGRQAKINQAFTLGEDSARPVASGGQVAKEMATVVTGLPIDYFMAIDFVGFQRLIGEELGGITVDIPQTLEDPWYPIKGEELNPCGKIPEEIAELTATYSGFELEKQFECRYEQLYFPQGEMHLEGGEALKYVRSRHGSSNGDFDRSLRQQVVLTGIKEKLLSLKALEKAPEIFETFSKHIVTDFDLPAVEYLLPAIKGLGQYQLNSVILSTDNVLTSGQAADGQFILRSKAGLNQWQDVRSYLEQELTAED